MLLFHVPLLNVTTHQRISRRYALHIKWLTNVSCVLDPVRRKDNYCGIWEFGAAQFAKAKVFLWTVLSDQGIFSVQCSLSDIFELHLQKVNLLHFDASCQNPSSPRYFHLTLAAKFVEKRVPCQLDITFMEITQLTWQCIMSHYQ